jgi:hypothetical protein
VIGPSVYPAASAAPFGLKTMLLITSEPGVSEFGIGSLAMG